MTAPNANDNAVRWERRVLAAVAESLDNWDAVSVLRPDDFSLSEHQQIFAGLARLASRGEQCDSGAWGSEFGDHLAATLAGMLDGAVCPPRTGSSQKSQTLTPI
jgi:replicative DNA helicase